ncbi:ATP-binding cassette domain-containing protein [Pseudoflavitalea sp. X16]|uniref:ABC transporter ATP-binding protein n=1 Tax=Paraflavitalea devenefica TaxID=2716334 RepID=UPI0014226A0F|nr:ATP-binding cassette domain-containing protein [Paraflavitalea devenefica]NII23759.1 ATP-binding cassette domain-containing protein [Paraflavitalea devenefica]
MKISLTKAGKRFNRDWIFRNITYEFNAGNAYAITGPNGSGKSTLLQVIGGALMMSEGDLRYEVPGTGNQPPIMGNGKQSTDNLYQHIAIAAPYLEVIEEMTVTEFLAFHTEFKTLLPGITIKKIIDVVGLEKAAHKQIRYYSSGMKQRVKLAQAIFSDVPCLLLDEPCTNLDTEGIALYQQLINDYCANRLVIVSSNDSQEYGFCKEKISILDYK